MDWNHLREHIQRHEGCVLKPYPCPAGALTIGYGHNLDAKGITRPVAEIMLDEDLRDAYHEALHLESPDGAPVFQRLDPVRQEVLVHMVFNLGFAGVLGFTRMLTALAEGDYERASAEMYDSRWAKQVYGRANSLAQQMRTGRLSP